MIISDLSHLEAVENCAVSGATGRGRNFSEVTNFKATFDTTNKFETVIKGPAPVHTISASAGAKGIAEVKYYSDVYSFTKGDSYAIVDDYGNSISYSSSAALINW